MKMHNSSVMVKAITHDLSIYVGTMLTLVASACWFSQHVGITFISTLNFQAISVNYAVVLGLLVIFTRNNIVSFTMASLGVIYINQNRYK